MRIFQESNVISNVQILNFNDKRCSKIFSDSNQIFIELLIFEKRINFTLSVRNKSLNNYFFW